VVLIYFFYNLFKQQRSYKKLQQDKLNAEIATSELERNFIATELHNDIGPYLASVKMRLGLIESENRQPIKDCEEALDFCVGQIRNLAKTLAPLSIYKLSFKEALQNYINKIKLDDQLVISLTTIEEVPLTEEQSSQLYRIMQEIILNTIKHAQAKTLRIELSREDDKLLIRTADDGKGYNMEKLRDQDKLGLGLLGIQSRIDFLKGSMVSADDYSKGTRYNIRVPITIKR
jgi:signal transduction histidine kinase